MKRILADDRAKLAFASAIVQVTNFLFLLLARIIISDEDFAIVLTQLAIAGIIGAIASLRLEVLMYQAHGCVTRSSILAPILAIAVVIALNYAGFFLAALIWNKSPPLSPIVVPFLLGIALSAVLNFALVQAQRLNLLVAVRSAQCAMLTLLMAFLGTRWWTPSGSELLIAMGLSYLLPSLVLVVRFIAQVPTNNSDFPVCTIPDWVMIRRSISLTFSTGVNSIYVNLPLLAAAATQNASFISDFGLIMRAVNAPITLIGQVTGRLFLASAMHWSIAPERVSSALSGMVWRAMAQSLGLYLLITPVLIGVFYFYREPLNFTNLGIVPYLFLAGLGQCVINSVAQVRTPLHDERAFLMFDSARLLVLTIGLYGGGRMLPFEIAFGGTSLLLYTSYIPFIFLRVARYSPI
ncbi:MAG: hypothetical protein ACSHWZ_18740 [Sulfitobacter sp.]|uniref:hypothetical protein n=1 Tax=Celeribacter marinus TaxID=1397108 RepID=UPI00317C7B23